MKKLLLLTTLLASSLVNAELLTDRTGVRNRTTIQSTGAQCQANQIAIRNDGTASASTNNGGTVLCVNGIWRRNDLPVCNEASTGTAPTGTCDYSSVCFVKSTPPQLWACGANGNWSQIAGGSGSTLDTNSNGIIDLGSETAGSYAAGDAEAGNATGLICTDCVALTTETTGNYVASGTCTASQGLTCSGNGEAATFTVALQDCAANEVLKRNAGDTAWACAADNAGSGGSNYALAVDADQDGTNPEVSVNDATNTVRMDPDEDGDYDLEFTSSGINSTTGGLSLLSDWISAGNASFAGNITQDAGKYSQFNEVRIGKSSSRLSFYDNGTATDEYFRMEIGGDGILQLTDQGAITGQVRVGSAVDLADLYIYGSIFMETAGAVNMFESTDPSTTANKGKLYTKDVSTVTELFYKDSAGSVVQITSGGTVNGAGGGGAPTTAQYITGTANATLTAEQVLTEGTALDLTLAGGDGGAATLAFDSTEVGATTWGSGGDFTWTLNSAGTDPTLAFSSGNIDLGATDLDVNGDIEGDGSITFDPDDDGVQEARINSDGSFEVLTASSTPGLSANDGLWLIGDGDSDQAGDPTASDAVNFDSDEDTVADVVVPAGTQGRVWVEKNIRIGSPSATVTNAYDIDRTTLSGNEAVWIDGDADGTVDTTGVDACLVLGTTGYGYDSNCNGTAERSRGNHTFERGTITGSVTDTYLYGFESAGHAQFTLPYAVTLTGISCVTADLVNGTSITATVEAGGVDSDLAAVFTNGAGANTTASDTTCTSNCSAAANALIKIDVDTVSITSSNLIQCTLVWEW